MSNYFNNLQVILRFSLLIILSIISFSCKDDDPMVEPSPCENFRPIIFLHGALASGDTYTKQVLRFSSNGCDANKIFVFDWNTLDQNIDNLGLLDEYIDKVLAETGATQVDLTGHSAGGGLSWNYISDSVRVQKVAHYVHIGSFNDEPVPNAAARLPILNIYSTDDTTVPGADIAGVTNLEQTGFDHYEVATNAETFTAMYQFFRDDEMPETTDILSEDEVLVSGRALTLGENSPEAEALIDVYKLDATTGFRSSNTPAFSFIADADGYWGPFEAEPTAHYEFYIVPADENARSIHYYREPFLRSNPLVYLRTFPPTGGLVGILNALLPSDDTQAVMAAFTSSQAFVAGRDELFVDQIELSTPALSSADQTTIALFLYDDGDGLSSETPNPLLASFPFLHGSDVFFDATTLQSFTYRFNGRTLNVPGWKSASEGVVVVVFD